MGGGKAAMTLAARAGRLGEAPLTLRARSPEFRRAAAEAEDALPLLPSAAAAAAAAAALPPTLLLLPIPMPDTRRLPPPALGPLLPPPTACACAPSWREGSSPLSPMCVVMLATHSSLSTVLVARISKSFCRPRFTLPSSLRLAHFKKAGWELAPSSPALPLPLSSEEEGGRRGESRREAPGEAAAQAAMVTAGATPRPSLAACWL